MPDCQFQPCDFPRMAFLPRMDTNRHEWVEEYAPVVGQAPRLPIIEIWQAERLP